MDALTSNVAEHAMNKDLKSTGVIESAVVINTTKPNSIEQVDTLIKV